ncbi:LLM class flavin-dependent oxidoreductase [Cryptosporangium aurantiacum]|uniref:Hemerythrin HHE cation binding domain-containing protein n=1 Tax=Cryptosporangium aurantiacum TaxID=134849 RepID=A0A1M7RGB3_9ACTN|nr:LLM class flavin-dependent oxidoreductase [Cryptosporangium aurantiacum]SHN45078.1 Hemerythrin HHE cation binding domain-containing protein [Cryptosporangium aurantiacum]
MADYGHDLVFGTFLTPTADAPDRVVALAQLTEQVGLDLATVQDHPYQARFLDTWTLLSVIAARTTTLRVTPNVVNLPLRPPAVLAKSVASLDLLTGGRVELGLGSGAFWDGIAALGGRRLTPAQGVDALAEAIRVIRALWAPGGSVRLDGEYYRVAGAHAGPAPAHDVGIWLGAYKKRMLTLTGRAADGWLPSSPYAGPDQLPAMNATIDAAAEEAGRDPREIRRLYNISGRFAPRGTGFLTGPPAMWAEQLAELALGSGISGFITMGDDPDEVRRFAAEVVPAVNDLVDAERGRRAGAPPSPDRTTATGSSVDAGRVDAGWAPTGSDTTGRAAGTAAPAAGGTAAPAAAGSAAASAAGSTAAPAAGSAAAAAGSAAASAAGSTAAAGRLPVGLGITPTPDDGVRLSDVRLWDETTRPTGPAPDADRAYTPAERASGQHLIDVHDHLRSELTTVRDLVEQVADGLTDPGAARSAINAMTMRQNNWTLGTYCESYCRVVTTHHTLEDQALFPRLRRADAGLVPVVNRLVEEHLVIHEVLERVDRALVALVTDEKAIDDVRAAVDLLSDTLLSHLSYEERELVEPLARFGIL